MQVSLGQNEMLKTPARVKRVEKKREGLYELGLMFVDPSKELVQQVEKFIMRSLSAHGVAPEEDDD